MDSIVGVFRWMCGLHANSHRSIKATSLACDWRERGILSGSGMGSYRWKT
ncbi:unnamed protein product, partial [Musa acuminata subsp. burmannicoides]